jgi:hypothetical protein
MRYVVGRDRQAAAGQLIVNIIYLFDNVPWKNISPTFRTRMTEAASGRAAHHAASACIGSSGYIHAKHRSCGTRVDIL